MQHYLSTIFLIPVFIDMNWWSKAFLRERVRCFSVSEIRFNRDLAFNFPHDRLTTQTAGVIVSLRNQAIIPGWTRAFHFGRRRTIKPVPSLSGNVRSTSDEARTGAPVSGRSVRGWIIIFRRNEGDLVVTDPTCRLARPTSLRLYLSLSVRPTDRVAIAFQSDGTLPVSSNSFDLKPRAFLDAAIHGTRSFHEDRPSCPYHAHVYLLTINRWSS